MDTRDKELLHIQALTSVIDTLFTTAWYSGKGYEERQLVIMREVKKLRAELAKEYYGYPDG